MGYNLPPGCRQSDLDREGERLNEPPSPPVKPFEIWPTEMIALRESLDRAKEAEDAMERDRRNPR